MSSNPARVTEILEDHVAGDHSAVRKLLPVVYDALRKLAGFYLSNEQGAHTLQPTALVHEAFLKLVNHDQIDWKGAAHFKALAATTMRRVLVDHAEARRAQKRGGGDHPITLHEEVEGSRMEVLDILDLDAALSRLKALHERQSRVVELKFFGGLTSEEVADMLGVTDRTVKNDWRAARAWLLTELEGCRE